MAHTPRQRDRMALCGAKKKNGETCRAFAGQGTDHPGIGRCKFHLGNAAAHRKHAAKVEAQRRVVKFGQPLPVEPTEALLGVLHLSAGHLTWIRSELDDEMLDTSSFERDVLMRMWDEERDRI